MFPLTQVPFWYRFLEQPFVFPQSPRRLSCASLSAARSARGAEHRGAGGGGAAEGAAPQRGALPGGDGFAYALVGAGGGGDSIPG